MIKVAKLKVAVLISGRGSNFGALARATMNPDYPAEIVCVISNRPNAAGLEIAQEHGIAYRVFDHKEYETKDAHETAISDCIAESGAQIVCLAGYMRILSSTFVKRWRGKVLNIHPSPLPSFRGVDTHERALEAGVRIHGCTVHFVTAELDAGPIIVQGAVPVLPDDTPETLATRALEVEHELYPRALALIADKKVRWSGDASVTDSDVSPDEICLFQNT